MRRLISLLILIAGLAGPAFAQESDKDYLTRWLEENLSSAGREVVITGFRGALSSQASLDELTIADDVGIWLTLRGVTLDWSRAALLSGRVEIKTLTASEILLPRGPLTGGTLPAPEASSFSLPELPVSVQIDTLKADRVALGEALFGAAAEVSLEGAMSLAGGEGEATLAIRRIDGAEGALTLAGSYSNASRQLALDLDVAEAADGIAANLIGLPGAPALVLTIAGAGPIDDYAADIRLATDGQERLAGRVVLTSEVGADALAAKRFHAELGGDIAPLLAPDYAAFFGRDVRLVSDGTWLADGRVEVSKLEIGAAAITLSGRARLGADHLPEIIALTGRIADPHGGMVVLPLPGARSELRSATLDLRFDAAKGDDWTGSVQLTDLQRSEGSAASLTLTGSGRIARDAAGAGTVDAKLRFSGSGVVAANPALAEALGSTLSGALEAHWRAGQALDLPAFSLRGAGYAVTGAGTLGGLDTGLRFAGQIKAQVDNLALGSALAGRTLSGAAEAGIAGSTELLSGVFDLDAWIQGVDLGIGQTEADNALRGPTSIAVSAKRDATGIELRSLVIRAATLTANAAGRIETGATRVEGGFDFTDLASLGGPYGGALRGSAVVLTDARGPAVTLAATGRGLRTGTAELDQVLDGISLVTLQARLQGDAVALTRLDLHAAGLVADISGSLQPGASRLVANLQFPDLAVLGPGYRGAVQAKAELAETGTARQVTLTGIGSDLGIGQTNIDPLLRGATLLTLDVVQDQGRVRINTAKLENPQLLATASGIQTADGRSLEVAARLSDMASLAPGFPGVLTLQGALQETAAGYNLDITGVGPGNIQAKVTGTAAIGFGTVDLAIAGTAAAGLVNALVAPANLSGPVRYDLRLSGPPGLAALSGTVSTQGLRIVTQIFGQTLEGVTATATLAGGQAQITATAGVANAPGQISVSGPVSLTAPYNGQLAIGLAGPLVVRTELYTAFFGGALKVDGPVLGGATISGQIDVQEAEVRVPSTGLGGIAPIPEIIHRNEPADAYATRVRAGLAGTAAGNGRGGAAIYQLDLTISVPKKLFVRGRGLEAELGGSIRLTGTTANVIPVGGFDLIRGRLDILGKRFSLDEGTARLEGRLIPFIRLAASTDSDGFVITVQIEGEATDPRISFVSSPELPEEEVLTRLLFGRDLTSISPLQAAQLASAVATLAGRSGDGVIDKLRRGLKIDDLDISTDAEGKTALRAGKYISDKVYSDVTVDSDGKSEVTLNIDLTPETTVRGSLATDGNTSLGLFYEKDY